jgi:hypothetical protein
MARVGNRKLKRGNGLQGPRTFRQMEVNEK